MTAAAQLFFASQSRVVLSVGPKSRKGIGGFVGHELRQARDVGTVWAG